MEDGCSYQMLCESVSACYSCRKFLSSVKKFSDEPFLRENKPIIYNSGIFTFLLFNIAIYSYLNMHLD